MNCFICDAPVKRGYLCENHEARLVTIWKIEPIAVYCPLCGCSPLEFELFEEMFPDSAAHSPSKEFPLVAILYNKRGCYRCSKEDKLITAVVKARTIKENPNLTVSIQKGGNH